MIDVILVGTGARARAWAALLQRARAARVVALVARPPARPIAGFEVPRFDAVSAACAAFPDARAAIALPPRAGLDAALALAAAGRAGVVGAPVHPALAHLELPDAAASVAVAHGWVTLPSRAWVERMIASEAPAARVSIEARGLPEERGGDVGEVLIHALALARRLSPEARVEAAAQPHEAVIEVTLKTPVGTALRVTARAEGHGLSVRAEGASFDLTWTAEDERETVSARVDGARSERTRAVPPAAQRALHQLADPDGARGDTLRDAQRVARLASDVTSALGRRLPLGGRSLRHAARIAVERPHDLLAQLGLVGALPAAAPAPSRRVPTPDEPLELWPFLAGNKPVAFLTTSPGEVERVRAPFGEVHVERRERRVQVGAQDAWTDRRDAGEPRVELYLSREPDLARRAARLQTEGDPSGSLREIGALMGYPACCVEAFAAQVDRSNNTHNRYATAARTAAPRGWPWELANLSTMVIPCYPCSYTCAAALELARSALAAMDAAHPGAREALRRELARPVLYFDHERQLALYGEAEGHVARYSGVSVPEGTPPDFAAFAGALAAGDELRFDDEALEVRARGRALFTLRRTDPGLGLLAPFA